MSERGHILVVDDQKISRDPIVETLINCGYKVDVASDGFTAVSLVEQGDYDIIVSDMKMPGMSGIELLERVKKIDPEIPFIIITAYGAIETAVEAIKKGAFDFIQKTNNLTEELKIVISRALEYRKLLKENVQLKNQLQNRWQFIGSCKAMKELKKLISSIAPSRSTVLITGESGTGKELAARSIHNQSNRSNGPFIKINCAAIPESLIESELFGHEKGAFTGAIKRRKGIFEAASGGTLLLDEISEMPLVAQAKLLRVLQEKEVQKVGAEEPVEVDVRVIATTNRILEEEIRKGRFREDLYYRLNVIHLQLPPLRERKEDIPELISFFVNKFNDENGFNVSGIEEKALKILLQYNWPGNVRELENAIERAVVLTRSGTITAEMFNLKAPSDHSIEGTDDKLRPGMTIAEAERILIFKTLEACNQNRTKAAEMLGISIRTLRNKLNEYEAIRKVASLG
ncbi:MAG: sigma-54 dependent transcriptional regulator [Chitinispirillaceae bacterium]|nr:sigma-54 dependent transcriptional regulator [Chitinispirillaceae bacterium]